MSYFSDDQVELLLKPIHPNRVSSLRGLSYVEGHDIRAELTRVFGFGRWSEETMEQHLICETETTTKAGGKAWYVVYKTRVRLHIDAPDGTALCYYDGAHVGESTHPVRGEAHGNALTNSQTYALRRCAINLGDQFGLSLYNKGSMEAIVRWTLVRPENIPADTEDIPVITPEEPEFTPEEPAEAQPEVKTEKPARARKPKTEIPLEQRINDAATVDELRACFKEAGSAGKLGDIVTIPGTEKKIVLREWLFQRSDELGTPKSTDSPEADPGNSDGDK